MCNSFVLLSLSYSDIESGYVNRNTQSDKFTKQNVKQQTHYTETFDRCEQWAGPGWIRCCATRRLDQWHRSGKSILDCHGSSHTQLVWIPNKSTSNSFICRTFPDPSGYQTFVPRPNAIESDGIPKRGGHHAFHRTREYCAIVWCGVGHRSTDVGHRTGASAFVAGVFGGP